MRYAVIVHAEPSASMHQQAIEFCQHLQQCEHSLLGVFFFHHAVYVGTKHSQIPADEFDPLTAWQSIHADTSARMMLCVAAANRRGICDTKDVSTIADTFELVGLGQLMMLCQSADRVVQF